MGVDQPLELVFFIYSLYSLKSFSRQLCMSPLQNQLCHRENKREKLKNSVPSVVKVLALV